MVELVGIASRFQLPVSGIFVDRNHRKQCWYSSNTLRRVSVAGNSKTNTFHSVHSEFCDPSALEHPDRFDSMRDESDVPPSPLSGYRESS